MLSYHLGRFSGLESILVVVSVVRSIIAGKAAAIGSEVV